MGVMKVLLHHMKEIDTGAEDIEQEQDEVQEQEPESRGC